MRVGPPGWPTTVRVPPVHRVRGQPLDRMGAQRGDQRRGLRVIDDADPLGGELRLGEQRLPRQDLPRLARDESEADHAVTRESAEHGRRHRAGGYPLAGRDGAASSLCLPTSQCRLACSRCRAREPREPDSGNTGTVRTAI